MFFDDLICLAGVGAGINMIGCCGQLCCRLARKELNQLSHGCIPGCAGYLGGYMPSAIRALIAGGGYTNLVGHESFHASGHSPIDNFRAVYNFLAVMGVLALCFHTTYFLIFADLSQRAICRGLIFTGS